MGANPSGLFSTRPIRYMVSPKVRMKKPMRFSPTALFSAPISARIPSYRLRVVGVREDSRPDEIHRDTTDA
jgi:hypothetical protein